MSMIEFPKRSPRGRKEGEQIKRRRGRGRRVKRETRPPEARTGDAGERAAVDHDGRCLQEKVEDASLSLRARDDILDDEMNDAVDVHK